MQPMVTKWQPGQPTWEAKLPEPVVRYLEGYACQMRLLAVYLPYDRDPYIPDHRQPYVKCHLHLEFAEGTDPLGNPYWRPVEAPENGRRLFEHGYPATKIIKALLHHLAAALGIPTAAEVEASLQWREVPDPPMLQEAV